MADFQDEILATYKTESDPVFELVPVDTNEYKFVLKNTISQAGTPFALSNIATSSDILDETAGNKLVTPKALTNVLNEITAGETVAVGNPLYIDPSSGKAKVMTFLDSVPDLIVLTTPASASSGHVDVFVIDDNYIATFYDNGTNSVGRVIDVSDPTTPVLGSEFTIGNRVFHSCKLDSTRYAVLHATGNTLYSTILTANTTTKTFTETGDTTLQTNLNSASISYFVCETLTSTSFIVEYAVLSTDTKAFIVTLDGSDNETVNTSYQVDSSVRTIDQRPRVLSSTEVALFYYVGVPDYFKVATISGTAISFSSASPALTSTYMSSIDDKIIGMRAVTDYIYLYEYYNDSGTIKTRKTTSLGFTIPTGSIINGLDTDDFGNLIMLTRNSSGVGYDDLFVFKHTESGQYNFDSVITGGILADGDDSGTSNDFEVINNEQKKVFVTNRDILFYCGSGRDGTFNQGTCIIKMYPTFNVFDRFVGFATKSGVLNDKIKYIKSGVLRGLTGLTAGSTYYVQSDGSYSTTQTQFKIGTAISTTEISLAIEKNKIM